MSQPQVKIILPADEWLALDSGIIHWCGNCREHVPHREWEVKFRGVVPQFAGREIKVLECEFCVRQEFVTISDRVMFARLGNSIRV